MGITLRRHAIGLVLLCFSGACAPLGSGEDVRPRAPWMQEEPGTVQIVNDGSSAVVLYVLRDGMRYRLGRLARMQQATFRLPPADTRRPSYRLTLVADPVTSGTTFAAQPLRWQPGQHVVARIGRAYVSRSFDVWLR